MIGAVHGRPPQGVVGDVRLLIDGLGIRVRSDEPAVVDAVATSYAAFRVSDETPDDDSVKISAEAFRRKITVQLEAVTPALTRLKMVVRRGWFGRDRATASELIEQAARALADIRPIAGASPRAP